MSYPTEYFLIMERALDWYMETRNPPISREQLDMMLLDKMDYIISRYSPDKMAKNLITSKKNKAIERWIYMESINIIGTSVRDHFRNKGRQVEAYMGHLDQTYDDSDDDAPTMEELMDFKLIHDNIKDLKKELISKKNKQMYKNKKGIKL